MRKAAVMPGPGWLEGKRPAETSARETGEMGKEQFVKCLVDQIKALCLYPEALRSRDRSEEMDG